MFECDGDLKNFDVVDEGDAQDASESRDGLEESLGSPAAWKTALVREEGGRVLAQETMILRTSEPLKPP